MIANLKRDLSWHKVDQNRTLPIATTYAPCWIWSKSLGSTSRRTQANPRNWNMAVNVWLRIYSFTVFMAFLTKFFSHRCLTLWNQTSKTGDFEVIRLCGPSLCTDSLALSLSDCTWAGKTSGTCQCLYAQSFTFCGCTYGNSVAVWFWDISRLVPGIIAIASGTCVAW